MGPLRQGNNETIQYSVTAGTGGPQDITSWTFLFRVQLVGASGFVITKTSPTQISIISAPAGTVDVYLEPADTNPPFSATAKYLYDFQGTDASGNVFTLDSGSLSFVPILS